MITRTDLIKCKEISPIYLKPLLNVCIEFYDQGQHVLTLKDFANEGEVGKLFTLSHVLLEEYLFLVAKMNSDDKELLTKVRNDAFSVLSQFFTKEGKDGGFARPDWYKVIDAGKAASLSEQVFNSVLSFIWSRIYNPIMAVHILLSEEKTFLNLVVSLSAKRAGFYPKFQEKSPNLEGLWGEPKEEKKELKEPKDKKSKATKEENDDESIGEE
jgi:hypothetical protein